MKKFKHLAVIALVLAASSSHAQSFTFDIPNIKKEASATPQKNNHPQKSGEKFNVETKTFVQEDEQCKEAIVAMTFHNIPTQKGPYFHRWMNLGCGVDELTFVKEGNEQFKMSWKLTQSTPNKFDLEWKVTDVQAKEQWEAEHHFTLDKPKTLSLTNNMAVTIRRVPN